MKLNELNNLPEPDFIKAVSVCLGSETWQKIMAAKRPFINMKQLFHESNDAWYNGCTPRDWQEAFTHHPAIGDVQSIAEKFSDTREFAGSEQASVKEAAQDILDKLLSGNKKYADKFGFIFIVYASGKSAAEMLSLLESRLRNTKEEELAVAMGEQQKITQNRLKKMLNEENVSALGVSQLTTHVLDTSTGIPGRAIVIKLKKNKTVVTEGITNRDGRIPDLLPSELVLKAGDYTLFFDTYSYYQEKNIETFYPFVEINFTITGDEHYHVPLLINPFGYSTYRGS